jgi:Transglycosylase-like domain
MRRQLLLIAAPLCAVVIAASVAQAAPTHGEHFNDTKLDNLHAVRPIAASPSSSTNLAEWIAEQSAEGGHEYVESLFYAGVAAEAAAEAAAADAAAAAAANRAGAPVRSAGPPAGGGDFLSCVRQRESGGDYSIHNSGGSGAAGAYQMMPGTWNNVAAATGRTDLVGVDPASASPADQDAMAQALYAQQGARPWGGGC